MNGLKVKYTVILVLIFFVQNLFGQMYQFKEYGLEEGLSHPFVYTISEDNNGYVWIGTGEGLCQFDGFEFKVSEEDDSLTNGFVTSSYLGDNGILWFGHNSGQITYFNGISIKLLDIQDEINSTIIDIIGDEKGNVYIATQNNGIVKVNRDLKIDFFTNAFSDKLIYSILPLGKDNFLIGTSDGLSLYSLKDNEFVESYSVKELDYITVQTVDLSSKENVYWIGTEDAGLYLLKTKGENFESYEISNIGEKYNLENGNIQSVFEDNKNIVWISTFGKGIIKLIPDEKSDFNYSNTIHYSATNGLSNDFIKTVYQDRENNYWIATYGNGLALSVDEAFVFLYNDGVNILSIAESETTIWLGGESVITKIDKSNNNIVLLDQKNGIPNDKIVTLFLDKNNKLWIGTKESGIYQLNTESDKSFLFYKSNNSLANKINSITGSGNIVWAGTENGVLEFDLINGKNVLYNTSSGLPHNNIRYVYVDSDKNPWISTKSNGVFV